MKRLFSALLMAAVFLVASTILFTWLGFGNKDSESFRMSLLTYSIAIFSLKFWDMF